MPHILRVPAGSDRSRSLLTPIVALVAVVVLGRSARPRQRPRSGLTGPHCGPGKADGATRLRPQFHRVYLAGRLFSGGQLIRGRSQSSPCCGSDHVRHCSNFGRWIPLGQFLAVHPDRPAPALSCPSTKSCVAVGGTARTGPVEGGEALRTADGGETWVRSIIPPGVGALRGVSCPTKAFCVAVGEAPDGNRGVALMSETPAGSGHTYRYQEAKTGSLLSPAPPSTAASSPSTTCARRSSRRTTVGSPGHRHRSRNRAPGRSGPTSRRAFRVPPPAVASSSGALPWVPAHRPD